MRLSVGRVLVTAAIVMWLVVMVGTAGSQGFFGTMFEGFGDMFGDMFGPVAETVSTGTPRR
jgi:hypothetical protein